jgi:hypothetical protein
MRFIVCSGAWRTKHPRGRDRSDNGKGKVCRHLREKKSRKKFIIAFPVQPFNARAFQLIPDGLKERGHSLDVSDARIK